MSTLQRNNVKQLPHTDPNAPVMVYAHGFGCNQDMWQLLTPEFRATHRQVLFDYVGSGSSDARAFDPIRYGSLAGYAQDLIEVCDALGLTENVIFVGHSVSCSIGILASIQRPELFSQMILVGPSPCFLNDPPDYHGGFERKDLEALLALMDQNYIGWAHYFAPLAAGSESDQPHTSQLKDSFCSTDPVMARRFAQATFFADIREELGLCRTPSLILQHREDALVPFSVGHYLKKHLKDSLLETLDVKGHCAHMSHPHLVASTLRQYLSRSDSFALP
ncbi:alpha/beta hydrolase [Pseudomonas sp. 7P_10.2_Bac1]|uniref:alpha/beta fold hydrolase n=1 Tax=Pseudomonas sp. 7P_10.2_Bac1 TaxID=2971614 RepID=UPI0021C81CBF|nr:alpha/beta hydrolase [Pseudomonas sp. 7P_10.2_Bac1]MCU1727907.1 alpha/beta hydrolase [Pseudomonas sp. 7P_10.2_Bac1]